MMRVRLGGPGTAWLDLGPFGNEWVSCGLGGLTHEHKAALMRVALIATWHGPPELAIGECGTGESAWQGLGTEAGSTPCHSEPHHTCTWCVRFPGRTPEMAAHRCAQQKYGVLRGALAGCLCALVPLQFWACHPACLSTPAPLSAASAGGPAPAAQPGRGSPTAWWLMAAAPPGRAVPPGMSPSWPGSMSLKEDSELWGPFLV